MWQKVKSRWEGRLAEGGSAIIQKGSGHVGRGVGPLINSGFGRPTRFGNEWPGNPYPSQPYFRLTRHFNLTVLYTLNSRNIDPHNVTHSLMSRNPRERMFVVQISLLIVKFVSLISQNLLSMQITWEVNSHLRIAPCVKRWSVTFLFFFFFLCHLLNVGACVRHIAWEGQVEWTTLAYVRGIRIQSVLRSPFVLFHNVMCYTNSLVSHMHVNTTKLCNITCTLVATGVILRNIECS
jgi:hypothetical protein